MTVQEQVNMILPDTVYVGVKLVGYDVPFGRIPMLLNNADLVENEKEQAVVNMQNVLLETLRNESVPYSVEMLEEMLYALVKDTPQDVPARRRVVYDKRLDEVLRLLNTMHSGVPKAVSILDSLIWHPAFVCGSVRAAIILADKVLYDSHVGLLRFHPEDVGDLRDYIREYRNYNSCAYLNTLIKSRIWYADTERW